LAYYFRFYSVIYGHNESNESSTSLWYTPKQNNFYRPNRILSALSDRHFDIYKKITNAIELWDTLEVGYGIDDVGIEFYLFVVLGFTSTINTKLVHQGHPFCHKNETFGLEPSELR
jgi:hypothetical protein